MSEQPVMLDLWDVVAELVDAFRAEGDPSSWPLLARLEDLVVPGQTPPGGGEGRPRRRGQQESPAPWAAAPAELLDEILTGAVRLDLAARDVLGFGPLYVDRVVLRPDWPSALGERSLLKRVQWAVPNAPRGRAGVAALRDLPGLLEHLTHEHPSHPLAGADLVDPDRPFAGRRWGQIERQLRGWHRRAQELTGHRPPQAVLGRIPNPYARRRHVGPSCQDPWSCGHTSCTVVDLSTNHPAWIEPTCPHCGNRRLPLDPVTGLVFCDRRACAEGNGGRRREWSVAVATTFGSSQFARLVRDAS